MIRLGLKFSSSLIFAGCLMMNLYGQSDPLSNDLQKASEFRSQSVYDSAIYYYQRSLDTALARGDRNAHIKTLNGLGLVYIDLSKYSQAESFLLESIVLGKKHLADNDEALGEAYGRLAYCYSQSGEIEKAIANYNISLEIFKNGVGEISQPVANTYSNLGGAYYLLGNQSEIAIQYLNKSIEINQQLDGQESLEMARAYNDLANVYNDLEDFEQAIYYHKLSLKIKEKVMEAMHPALGVSHFNLARSYFAMGDYQRSIDHYHHTLKVDIATFGEDHRWVGEDYYSIADCFNARGNHQMALKYSQKASDIMLLAFGPKNHRLATTYNTLGQVQRNLGNLEAAQNYFNKALDILSSTVEDSRDITHGLAFAHKNMGIIKSMLGEHDQSISHHQKSLELNQQILPEGHHVIAQDFQNLAYTYAQLNQEQKALQHYGTALEMLVSTYGNRHPEIARWYLDMGDYYLDRQQADQALDLYQTALQSLVPSLSLKGHPNPSLKELSLLPITLDILNQKGWAYHEKYRQQNDLQYLKNAMNTYSLAVELIDTLRVGFLAQGSKQSLLENHHQVYERSLFTAHELLKADQGHQYLNTAFYTMEKSKSFLLLSSLRESNARSFANIPSGLLEKEQDLRVNLAFYETKAQSEKVESKKSQWRNKAFALNKSYDSLMLALSKSYPEYHKLKYNTSVISLSEFQNSLTSDEMFIQYFMGDSILYSLAVTSQDKILFSAAINKTFLDHTETLRKTLSEKLPFSPKFAKASFDLYQKLLVQVEHLMAGKTLTIVADGLLNYIPFEVLNATYEGSVSNFAGLNYLIRSNSINYTFSATLLSSQEPRLAPTESINYLAFAPQFNQRGDAVDLEGQLALNETIRGSLSELKGTLREAASINSYFEGRFLQGPGATEAQFKENAGSYQILHLATHAIVDDQNPMNSRLLFTVQNDSLEDGDLHVWELYNMKLNAQMAVLSACNTGYGKIQRGEGAMSLGRAFAYAGCPSIVMSLWPAQDEATADIMERFYQGIAQGLSKDRALAKAKIDYLQNSSDLFAHPFYWAGFVIQGDASPLRNSSPIPWNWLVAVLLLITLAVFYFRNSRKTSMP